MFSTILFYVLALVIVIAAFRVVTARSPVTAVLHLILTFFTAAMLWISMGAEFLGLLLIVVYVGAVMVMFLFVIMLLDVRMPSMTEHFKAYMPVGSIVGLIMIAEMAIVLLRAWVEAPEAAVMPENYNNTKVLGVLMYTDYVMAVQVGGVILLVGMVAAIALTLRRRSDVKRTVSSKQVKVRAEDRLRLVSMQAQVEQPSAASETNSAGDKQ
ncbi:NADH-quinone oxidoreductase subunit J [Paenalcaligenes suwonensis]|uniref:NADH-quinone oxidoreductase subunit J n=1 Tax=Paenalcaligenes suwonensis TaxID=1202713 RepID=UPI001409CD3E|nr:NADH-quinone oxidoreductase subunit J [Paenalcaligenes suwonensis]NHC61339.1 NADH-quinone oxidoreductase subunit J [Paenalcaligenes suwonensis]